MKVTLGLKFSPYTTTELSGPFTQLCYRLESLPIMHVCSFDNKVRYLT